MVSPAVSLPPSNVSIPAPHPTSAAQNGRRDARVNVGQLERVVSVMLGSLFIGSGLRRMSLTGLGIAGLGAALIQRGATGQCPLYKALNVTPVDPDAQPRKMLTHPLHQTIRVEQTISVEKPVDEVYRFWRALENLPRFMSHLESVKEVDTARSHWVAKGPRDAKVEWNADIVAEEENRRLAWKSVEGADVPNAGQVLFEPAPGGSGTVVKVVLAYDPPAGVLGALYAKLFGQEPTQQIKEDLRHFKQILEAGESPTTEGQPQGSC
jgi:uncharacterized membrane protein